MKEDLLDGLNPQQVEAVLYNDGPMLILAGAGSGKTRTLITKIAYLIEEEGLFPGDILAVTFTNRAAAEMRERLTKFLDYPTARAVQAGTFHGLCARFLRPHAHHVGLKSSFTIFDDTESFSLIKRILEEHEVNKEEVNAGAVSFFIDDLKNKGHYRQKKNAKFEENPFYEYFLAYEEALEENNSVDFGSLITKMIQLLESNEDARNHFQNAFKYVLVDEFQDTNDAQMKLLKLIVGQHTKICAVGDGDQCLIKGTMISTPEGEVPIETLKEGDLIYAATKKYTKVAVPVSKVFKKEVDVDVVEITTNKGRKIVSTKEHTHFAEFSEEHSPSTFLVYLMFKEQLGFRIGVSQIYDVPRESDGFRLGFGNRLRAEGADKVWVLQNFKTETEARYFELVNSLKYQIPTIMFKNRISARKFEKTQNKGIGADQGLINKLFSEVNTFKNGKKLLKDFNLLFEESHYVSKVRSLNKDRNFVVSLLGSCKSDSLKAMHRINYNEFNLEKIKEVEKVVKGRLYKENYWRMEKVFSNLGDAYKLYSLVNKQVPVRLVENILLTDSSIKFSKATSVRPGMIMVNENFENEIVVKVEFKKYKGFVYDLNVDRFHNYIANGVFTHNSIYSWRGAEIKNIMEFSKAFPGAREYKLEENYRSTNTIVEASNEVIKKNFYRKDKNMFTKSPEGDKIKVYQCSDSRKESEFIGQEVRKLLNEGVPAKEIAVFYRNNSQSRGLEEVFRRMRISYELIGGQKFYERKEIRDLLAYMRLLVNSSDNVSFTRVINTPSRGIGDKALNTLLEEARKKGESLFDFVMSREYENIKLTAKTKEALEQLVLTYEQAIVIRSSGSLLNLYEHFLEGTGYQEYLEKSKKIEDHARLDNLKEFKSSLKGMTLSLEELLESLTLDQKQEEEATKEERVKLMTMHASKGLEFDHVFVVALEEGIFPSPQSVGRDLEEERRLFYVSMTRAKKDLSLFHALSRLMFGQVQSYPKSRFLYEIPSKYCRYFRI